MQKSDIMMLLTKINWNMKAVADAGLKRDNLTYSQINVLFFVRKSGGRVSQKEIEEYLKVSHPTVVGLVQRLENTGYIICERDENDKRNKLVSTTDQFEQLVKQLDAKRAANNERLLEGLSKQDLDKLTVYLTTIYENSVKRRENSL
ncbi:MAG: MarR family transcriptional regulator [Erysipelotrichaceae bacterium]|nr:MarR family transcriptional regulator [Erysipelotrichaceae bacterium]